MEFFIKTTDTDPIPDSLPANYAWFDRRLYCLLKGAEGATDPITDPSEGLGVDTYPLICSAETPPEKIGIATALSIIGSDLLPVTGGIVTPLLLNLALALKNNEITDPITLEPQKESFEHSVSTSLMKKRSQLPLTSLIPPSGGVLAWIDSPIELD